MTAHKTSFVEEKSVKSLLKKYLDPELCVLPGEINATYCARSNEGLATMSAEEGERFISLFSLIDCTQGLVCGGKVGRKSLENLLRSRVVRASR